MRGRRGSQNARRRRKKGGRRGVEKRQKMAKRPRSFYLRRASIDLQWAKVWRNPTPISRRCPAAWTIILLDKGYGGVHDYPTRSQSIRGKSCPRLFTQLTRLVLGIARGHVRTCVGKHPHIHGARNFEENSNVPPTRLEEVQRPPDIYLPLKGGRVRLETKHMRRARHLLLQPDRCIYSLFLSQRQENGFMDNGSVRQRNMSLFNV